MVVQATILIISLCSCTLFVAGACAIPNGYAVDPVTPDMDMGAPLGTVPADFWDLPPGIMLLSLLVSLSTMLGFPVELFFGMKFYAWLGYRKITQSTIFNNATRSRIYSCIRDNPGIFSTALVRMTDVKRGTLRYHLTILKLTGKITVLDSSGNARYFENSGIYSQSEKAVLKYVRNSTDCRIFRLLMENPGLSRNDLGNLLGLSASTISWRMNRLSGDNLIRVQKSGKNVRYGIKPEVQEYLEKYLVPDRAAMFTQSIRKSPRSA